MSNILRYPLEAPTPGNATTLFGEGATEAIDYVCFQRSKTSYDDGGYGGFSFPSSTGTAKREPNDKRVYMAMPKTLQTGFAPRYKQIDLGVMGAAALTAMNADLGGDMKELAATISQAADAALPEFAAGAIAEVTDGLARAGGLAGGLDASSIQALTKGRVFNPFKEQVFSGLDFRTHNFTFKLLSRSETEAKRVQDIINYFKFGALPSIGGTENSGGSDDGGTFTSALSGLNSQRFFNVPDNFDIKFIRLKPDASGGTISTKENDFMHFKIHPSVCTGIQINYTPDGQYTSFKSIKGGMVQVPAIQLGLTFAELKLVTKGDIAKGF